jgi:hypothetical protein
MLVEYIAVPAHLFAGATPLPLGIALTAAERAAVEAAVEQLIAVLDAADGDPDVELNGDELDGMNAGEDEFQHHYGLGPGCPISDPGGGDVGDEGEQELAEMVPHYGDDQTRGPTNDGGQAQRWFAAHYAGATL